LLSLQNQSVTPSEIILSDDGSDDDIVGGIEDIVKEFNYPVKYIKQPHKGFRLSRCRNNGVKISSGDILVFMDQDIIPTKNYLKTFIQHSKNKRFLTSYPVRLDEKQSELITENLIKDYDYLKIVNRKQIRKIKKQYIKDLISFFGLKIGFVKQKPKLRGGVCAINKADYYLVNGYDEMFKGWGNEDDDIRKRLYKAGVKGFNPFLSEFPMHLYHEPFHHLGKRVNQNYVDSKKEKIKNGLFKCGLGVLNTDSDDENEIIELRS